MDIDEIDEKYPEHTYNSCNDDDERCNNAGFNRCPRCTELELLRLQNMAIGASKLAQEARRHAATECLALCQEHFSTKFRSEYELGCVETASDIAHDISRKFGLEI